jgi:hypothetical protein
VLCCSTVAVERCRPVRSGPQDFLQISAEVVLQTQGTVSCLVGPRTISPRAICTAAAATLDALADGTLLDKHGEPLVFRRRRLQESYASRHKLEIVLGTLISFMVVKICEPCSAATCGPCQEAP